MSLPRLDYATHIADQLNELAAMVKTRSRASLTDANRILETIATRFFNALFGWDLVNLNIHQANYPAADLGDRQRRIAIQVTNEDSSDKIKRTTAKAAKHELGKEFDRLIVFFLLQEKPAFPRNFVQPARCPKIETWDIADLLKELQDLPDLLTLTNAAKVLDEEIGKFPAPELGPKFDISRIVKYAPGELIGRTDELKLLNDAWVQVQSHEPKRPHVLTFVALGGEGKTSLVSKWSAELAAQNWPGCDAAFAWSFYDQGTHERHAASSDLFLKEALNFFGDDADKAFAASSAGAYEKGQRLARIIGERRSLLILDGLEPLQCSPTFPTPGKLKDQGIAAVLKGLAARSRGLCLVTTRYSLPDMKAFWETAAQEVKLQPLSIYAGVHLLQKLGVRKESGALADFEKLVQDVKGHALTLNLLGTFLREAYSGNVRRRDRVKLAEADAEEQGGHAFRVMEAYVRAFMREGAKGKSALAILRLLGLFDRPASADCLDALWHPPGIAGLTDPLLKLGETQRNVVLTRLEDAKLLTTTRNASGGLISLHTHPLVREFFALNLRSKKLGAWQNAHQILYRHLQSTGPGHPDNIIAMDILYQAVVHGCLAGRFSDALHEVYLPRISRHNQFFSTYILAAFSSEIATLERYFDVGWKIIGAISDADKSIVLTRTGYALRAGGRLSEAALVLRQAVAVQRKHCRFKEASVSSGILSHVLLNLGRMDEAKQSALDGIQFAKQSGDLLQQITKQSILSQIYFYMSEHRRAHAAYQCGAKKEQLFPSAKNDPEFPILDCLATYNYSEFLMSEGKIDELVTRLNRSTMNWCQNPSRPNSHASALIELMLGRICVAQARLDHGKTHLDAALRLIMIAGREDDRSRVFMSRAELAEAKKDLDAWQSNLEDALEAATSSESAICQLDCYISWARLGIQKREFSQASRQLGHALHMCRFGLRSYRRRDLEIGRITTELQDVANAKTNP